MAYSYHQAQGALTGVLDPMQQDTGMSTYSLFGPAQYPASVAFWHDLSTVQPAMAAPAPSYPPKQPTLLQSIPDQKKHKRTRSGCFTCRARRIKCDESRPVCERCKKGSRDCVYPSPGPASSKAGARAAAKSRGTRPPSQGSDSSGKVEAEDVNPLEPIIDEEEPESAGAAERPSPAGGANSSRRDLHRTQSGQSLRKRGQKQAPESGSSALDASSSPSTEGSRFDSMSVRSASVAHSISDLLSSTRLSDDLQFYLNFHQEFISPGHFFLRQNSARFIHHSIIELALGYEPLLHALVGFSAYHHTLQTHGGKLYTFLKYYNKALVLLRKSLGSGEEYTEATLCTVLVLTTFEVNDCIFPLTGVFRTMSDHDLTPQEYIGDWVNLIDHHQAAHALMREILTPESVNVNELHTNIFLWYARFDVVAGILAGTEAILSRDWYISKEEYDAEQAARYPDDPVKQLVHVASINRRFGLEMASLYAKFSRGLIPVDEFTVQNEQLGQSMERAKNIVRQLDNSEYLVHSHPNQEPLTDDDIVDPYVPDVLHQGFLWDANYVWIDLLATDTMFKYQTMLALKQPLVPEIHSLVFDLCRLVEAIHRWPDKENGYYIGFKNCLCMTSMFLPNDNKHQMWSRRRLALMEQKG